jgi:hypothetical protein
VKFHVVAHARIYFYMHATFSTKVPDNTAWINAKSCDFRRFRCNERRDVHIGHIHAALRLNLPEHNSSYPSKEKE